MVPDESLLPCDYAMFLPFDAWAKVVILIAPSYKLIINRPADVVAFNWFHYELTNRINNIISTSFH